MRSMRSDAWLTSTPWISTSSRVRGRRLRLGGGVGRGEPSVDAFGDDALGLGNEGFDHLVLRHNAHDLAAHEEMAFAAPGGDPEVRLARLARTVDDTTHHGNLQRNLAVLERLLRLTGDADHVDLGPPTHGHAMRSRPLRSRRPNASSS